jgi:hypothetical protein
VLKGGGCDREGPEIFPGWISLVIRATRIFSGWPVKKRPVKPDLCNVSAESGGTRDQPP